MVMVCYAKEHPACCGVDPCVKNDQHPDQHRLGRAQAWHVLLWLLVFLVMSLSPGHAVAQEPAHSEGSFALGPGDILLISVWKDEELTREVIVRPDGMISFPLAGEVKAEGRTIPQLQQEMARLIEVYVPDTPVTVMLQQLRSAKVYVVGKVANPGLFIMEGRMNVLQALALAGGLTRFADKDGIHVIRLNRDGQEALAFDYADIANGEDLESNCFLQPGDTVVVP